MKKIFMLCLSLFVLFGCVPIKQIDLGKQVTLSFFYIKTCSECKAFKKDVIPLLKETFKEDIHIQQYDLDEETTVAKYDEIIDSLHEFDEEFYGNGPFIVLEDYFAILGYTSGDEDYLIDDIQKAIKGEELSYELEGLRFMFEEAL